MVGQKNSLAIFVDKDLLAVGKKIGEPCALWFVVAAAASARHRRLRRRGGAVWSFVAAAASGRQGGRY